MVRFTFKRQSLANHSMLECMSKTHRLMLSVSQIHKNLVLTMIKYLLVNISFLCLRLRSFSLAQNYCARLSACFVLASLVKTRLKTIKDFHIAN